MEEFAEHWQRLVCVFDGDFGNACHHLQVFGESLSGPAIAGWRPPTDIYETPDCILIKMALPGLQIPGDAEVTVHGREVVIQGQRVDRSRTNCTAVHHMEISYGRFLRRFVINVPFDAERVSARYEDGFLLVSLPKAAKLAEKRVRLAIHA